jgi:hydroxyacylglutathione hydrolase
MAAWRVEGRDIGKLPQWTVHELKNCLAGDHDLQVLDVRQPGEWHRGHAPKARHISGGELPGRTDDLDRARPVAVYCSTGYRSSVAASVLLAAGYRDVVNVLGGFAAWQNCGYPIER